MSKQERQPEQPGEQHPSGGKRKCPDWLYATALLVPIIGGYVVWFVVQLLMGGMRP